MISQELTQMLLRETARNLLKLSENDNWLYVSKQLARMSKGLDALSKELKEENTEYKRCEE